MPRPVLAAALAFAALAAAARPPSNRTARVVIFKHGRTGSTWMADLLKQQPAVAFFEHEANGCLKGLGALSNYRASVVAAPRCDMRCENNQKKAREIYPQLLPWVRPLPLVFEEAPACLAGKMVGFDVQPSNDYDAWPGEPVNLTWDAHWAPLVRLPRISTVLYVRSNLIKHHVSKSRAKLLVKLCATHKVHVGHRDEACYEAHRGELRGPLAQDAATISTLSYYLAKEWRSMLEHLHDALHGQRFLILYYEKLQTDPYGVIGDLFAYAGLPRGSVVRDASANDVKLSSDDLRQSIQNFSGVEAELATLNPCLLPQLRDTSYAVFPDLCLKAKDRPVSFDDYQVELS